MKNRMVLNIYDDDDKIIKTAEAKMIDLRFGTIRKLMEILQIDQVKDTSELLKVIYGAWGQITSILSKAFPDMEDADWENVKLSELVPILVTILKNSFAKIATIPTDEKNSMAE